MASSFLIMFREMLEMSMVLGVLFVVTRPVPTARRWIVAGSLLGLVGASFVAAFMSELENSLEGNGEFVYNAVVLALASVMIGWTVVWMSRHGRELTMRMKEVGKKISIGELPQTALMLIALAAVMREGSEAVFFMWGAAMESSADKMSMTVGGSLGAIAAVALGYIMYKGLLRIPVNYILRIVGWLLILLAAGMAGKSAGLLVTIQALPGLVNPLWDTSNILPSNGKIGQFLNVMAGYSDTPSATQVGVFVLSLVLMIWLYRHYSRSVIRPLDNENEPHAQDAHR